MWHNVYSSEQFFGLVGVEPTPSIVIDGDAADWKGVPPLYVAAATVNDTSIRDVDYIAATSDASYLYVLVRKANNQVWTKDDNVVVSFDSVPNQGSGAWSNVSGAVFLNNADAALQMRAGQMTMNVHSANDFFLRAYGAWLQPDVITDPNGLAGDTGIFSNMRLLVKVIGG